MRESRNTEDYRKNRIQNMFMVMYMNPNKKLLGLIFLSLLCASLPGGGVSPVTAGPERPWNVVDTFWGTAAAPLDVGPGDQKVPLSVVIQYLPKDPVAATGISILLDLDQHFTSPKGGDPVNYPTVVGGGVTTPATDFSPGATGTVQFLLNIKPNVLIGHPYSMELRVMYYENNVPTGGDLDYEVAQVPLKVYVLGRPQLEVEFQDTTLIAEHGTEITIQIENQGTAPANGMEVELTVPPPLIVTENTTTWELGQLPVNRTQALRVPLYAPKLSVTSTYQLVLGVSYRGQSGITHIETYYGGVVVHGNTDRSATYLEVEFSVENITAGKSNSLILQVRNPTSDTVFDAQVGLELPPPLILMGMDNQWQFDQILGQSAQEIPVQIYAPEAGQGVTYPIVATIAFKDQMGVDQMETRTLGLLVIGDIDLLVYELVTFPLEVPVGGNFTVSGSILNRGNVEAMYTNVTIVEDTNFYITASSTYYVGQIDPNAPIPFALTGYLQPGIGAGKYSLSIVVEYRDNFGGRYTLTTTLPVTVVPAEQVRTTTTAPNITQRFTDTFFRPLPLLITAIVIIVLWRILRKSEEED